jgi:hypothetical protein
MAHPHYYKQPYSIIQSTLSSECEHISSSIELHLELFDWMSFFRCVLVLLPHFDRLVALST